MNSVVSASVLFPAAPAVTPNDSAKDVKTHIPRGDAPSTANRQVMAVLAELVEHGNDVIANNSQEMDEHLDAVEAEGSIDDSAPVDQDEAVEIECDGENSGNGGSDDGTTSDEAPQEQEVPEESADENEPTHVPKPPPGSTQARPQTPGVPAVGAVSLETLEQLVAKAEAALDSANSWDEQVGPVRSANVSAYGDAMSLMQLAAALLHAIEAVESPERREAASLEAMHDAKQPDPLTSTVRTSFQSALPLLLSVMEPDNTISSSKLAKRAYLDGMAEQAGGRHLDATQRFLLSLTHAPAAETHEALANSLVQLGKHEHAVLHFASAGIAQPDNPQMMLSAIESLVAMGYSADALEGLEVVDSLLAKMAEADGLNRRAEALRATASEMPLAYMPVDPGAAPKASAMLDAILARAGGGFDFDTAMLAVSRAKQETSLAQLSAQRTNIEVLSAMRDEQIGEKIQAMLDAIDQRAERKAAESRSWWTNMLSKVIGPLVAAIGIAALPFTGGLSSALVVIGVAYTIADTALTIASEFTSEPITIAAGLGKLTALIVDAVVTEIARTKLRQAGYYGEVTQQAIDDLLSPEDREFISETIGMVAAMVIGIVVSVATAGAGASALLGAANKAIGYGEKLVRIASYVGQGLAVASVGVSLTGGAFGVVQAYSGRELAEAVARVSELEAEQVQMMMKFEEQSDELRRLMEKMRVEASILTQMLWSAAESRQATVNAVTRAGWIRTQA